MLIRVDHTGGLGPIEVELARGGGPVTPASRTTVRAVGRHRDLLAGTGIDWGAGTGLLAIAAGRIPEVERIVAFEYDADAVETARRNVTRAGVTDRVQVVRADLFTPVDPSDEPTLVGLVGVTDFLVANPPASAEGDGLEWRRRLLAGARRFLRAGAAVLLQVAGHYGEERIHGLEAVGGYRFVETVERSPWMPFDLGREDLCRDLNAYVAEEERGGAPYDFRLPDGTEVDAHAVAAGAGPPLTSWQVHQFERIDD